MKRKRHSDDLQECDLVLIDANGRSVKAHRALLIDRSEYFAQLLSEPDRKELQLNEVYLIELIHYLYSRESEYADKDLSRLSILAQQQQQLLPDHNGRVGHENFDRNNDGQGLKLNQNQQQTIDANGIQSPIDTSQISGDIEVLMHLLVLAKKYSFRQLYNTLLNEINYKLGPLTAIKVYRCACDLDLTEFRAQTRLMILSWLPRLQSREDFLTLSQEAIHDIFNAESPDIECDSKLDALTVWWSRNKHVDLTDLWVKIMMSREAGQ